MPSTLSASTDALYLELYLENNNIPKTTGRRCKINSLAYEISVRYCIRLRAKKGPAPPPLGNFADISYLEENFKPHLLRDVCTLCSGALVSDSLLHMLL